MFRSKLLYSGLEEESCHGPIRWTYVSEPDVFEAFVESMLVPRLNPGDIVVMDNVGAHKPARILERIRAASAHVLFLPPYSPDLNPIELFWNKFKELLRSMAARTPQELDHAIAEAMALTTLEDIAGWFTHCRYKI